MSIVRDSQYLIAANGIQLVLSLGTGILTARLLGPSGKGQLYLVVQIASMGSLLLGLGLGPAYQYHLAKGLYPKSVIMSHALAQVMLISLVVSALYLFGEPVVKIIVGGSLSRVLYLFSCIAIILNVSILYTGSILRWFPDGIRASSMLKVLSSIVNMVLLVVVLVIFKLGTVGAFAAYTISLLGLVIVYGRTVMSGVWQSIRLPAWSVSKSLLIFGASAFISNLMVSYVFRVDVFVLNYFKGSSDVGIYSVATAFAELVLIAPNALGVALFTNLPSANLDEQKNILGQSARMTILFALFVGILTAIFSYPFVMILMGQQFAKAVLPLILLIPGLIAMSVNYVFSNYYSAQGKPVVGAICFGLGLIVNLGLNLYFIPLLGISGAAISSTITYFFISYTFIHLLIWRQGYKIQELLIINRSDVITIIQWLCDQKTRIWFVLGANRDI